jgi:hypothetical protein
MKLMMLAASFYLEGKDGFHAGLTRSDNPYGVDQQAAHVAWDNGWRDGAKEQKGDSHSR